MGMLQVSELTGTPDQGYLKFLHDRSSVMAGLVWTDISFHPLEEWLKIWYGEDLTPEQEAELESLVDACQTTRKFKVQTGEEYFEYNSGNKKGSKHRAQVRFLSPFQEDPELELFEADFVGLTNLEIVKIDKNGFNFLIEASSSSKKSDDFTSVQFEWRAWLA